MPLITFQDSMREGCVCEAHACASTSGYPFVVYYRTHPYHLWAEQDVHLNDLERFMWMTCHLYEDEQSYTIVDDAESPPLLPGLPLSMFPVLYLTERLVLRHDVVPLRYQRWYPHRDPTMYRLSLSLTHVADEHLAYLPSWFRATSHSVIDIALSHPRINEILYLVMLHMETIKVREITLWNMGASKVAELTLQLLEEQAARVTREVRRIRVMVQGARIRSTLLFHVGTLRVPTPLSQGDHVITPHSSQERGMGCPHDDTVASGSSSTEASSTEASSTEWKPLKILPAPLSL